MKKTFRVISVALVCVACFSGFFWINKHYSYPTHRQIRFGIVNHPEFIPTSQTVKIASSGYENVTADFYWLSAIQYIGSNAISAAYKKYLAVMINLIVDLNKFFTYPYRIALLLLPEVNDRYEKLPDSEANRNIDAAVKIGLKGIENTCNKEKVALISQEFDLQKLWTENRYKNPCIDPNIPYYLAYVYYWNLHDGAKASQYYRITSANTDAPTGARIMAAIMQGKSGDREKAIMMFLSLAQSV